MNTLQILSYLIYLPITIGLTIWAANVLFKAGRVFMLDIFHGKEDAAYATNRLFKMSFYLLNIGYALWIMKIYFAADYDVLQLIERLSQKVGGFSIYLGVLLLLHLFLFLRGRRKATQKKFKPLVSPE